MIYVDWTLIYQIVLFVLLMVFLTKVLFNPMLKVFEAREKAHLAPEARAGELSDEARQARAEYERALSEARKTGESIRQELAKDAGEREGAILAEARNQADQTLSAAMEQIAESRRRLTEEVPKKADRLAMQLADHLLGR